MNDAAKTELEKALFVALIAQLPDPFSPDSASASRALEAAHGWMEELEKLKGGPHKPVVMRLIG